MNIIILIFIIFHGAFSLNVELYAQRDPTIAQGINLMCDMHVKINTTLPMSKHEIQKRYFIMDESFKKGCIKDANSENLNVKERLMHNDAVVLFYHSNNAGNNVFDTVFTLPKIYLSRAKQQINRRHVLNPSNPSQYEMRAIAIDRIVNAKTTSPKLLMLIACNGIKDQEQKAKNLGAFLKSRQDSGMFMRNLFKINENFEISKVNERAHGMNMAPIEHGIVYFRNLGKTKALPPFVITLHNIPGSFTTWNPVGDNGLFGGIRHMKSIDQLAQVLTFYSGKHDALNYFVITYPKEAEEVFDIIQFCSHLDTSKHSTLKKELNIVKQCINTNVMNQMNLPSHNMHQIYNNYVDCCFIKILESGEFTKIGLNKLLKEEPVKKKHEGKTEAEIRKEIYDSV